MKVILEFIDRFFNKPKTEKKLIKLVPISPLIDEIKESKKLDISKLKEDVFSTITEMSDEELKEKIDEHMREPLCQPDTCEGECQGTGWCDVATDFREKIYPPMVKML